MITSADAAWNQKDFEDTIGGDSILGRELIAEYRKQLASLLHDAEKAVAEKDFDELRRIGHKIKGSSAAISAKALAKRGARIEEDAKKHDIENIRSGFAALKDELAVFEVDSDIWQREYAKTRRT